MENKVNQVCTSCGRIFLRSRFHPQLQTCPECKKGGSVHCVFCKYSEKRVWDLYCTKHNRVVTESYSCKDLKRVSPTERAEILRG